jgi:creatinine amidohydrolase
MPWICRPSRCGWGTDRGVAAELCRAGKILLWYNLRMESHDIVDYERLLPHQFQNRLAQRPVGYLPLGTLEWHGPHNALGADALQSRAIFREAACRFGGIVLPPLWLGPDRIAPGEDGTPLIGMDTHESTVPHRPLPGSLYWVPTGLFHLILEGVLAQARRAGFRVIIADGHGPSRIAWSERVDFWERQYDLQLVSVIRDFGSQWTAMTDHAARNETSIMMAVEPELVDLARLPRDRRQHPEGVFS